MRRPHLALLLLTASTVAAAQARPNQLYTASREQLDVTKVLLAQENAWNRGDLDAYLATFKDAPDTEAILNAPVHGAEAVRAAFHTAFPNRDAMGTLEQSQVEVHELGPTFALALGHYHLVRSRKNGGDADGTFTDVFEKTDAGWKLIFTENT